MGSFHRMLSWTYTVPGPLLGVGFRVQHGGAGGVGVPTLEDSQWERWAKKKHHSRWT